jgi:hypothetical protein
MRGWRDYEAALSCHQLSGSRRWHCSGRHLDLSRCRHTVSGGEELGKETRIAILRSLCLQPGLWSYVVLRPRSRSRPQPHPPPSQKPAGDGVAAQPGQSPRALGLVFGLSWSKSKSVLRLSAGNSGWAEAPPDKPASK